MILSGYLVIGKQKSEWRTGPLMDAVGTLLTAFLTSLEVSAISGARRLDPGAAEDVGQGERDHQGEPEKSGQNDNSGEPSAVPKVHKEKSHQKHFYNRNRQRQDRIEWAEIDICDSGGQSSQDEQGYKHQRIGSNRRAFCAHL
jgi:hypothetical protein